MDGRHPGNEAAELCRHGQLTVFSQGDLRNGVAYCRRASELDPQVRAHPVPLLVCITAGEEIGRKSWCPIVSIQVAKIA